MEDNEVSVATLGNRRATKPWLPGHPRLPWLGSFPCPLLSHLSFVFFLDLCEFQEPHLPGILLLPLPRVLHLNSFTSLVPRQQQSKWEVQILTVSPMHRTFCDFSSFIGHHATSLTSFFLHPSSFYFSQSCTAHYFWSLEQTWGGDMGRSMGQGQGQWQGQWQGQGRGRAGADK